MMAYYKKPFEPEWKVDCIEPQLLSYIEKKHFPGLLALNDETKICNTIWSKLRTDAMKKDYKSNSWFVSFPTLELSFHLFLVPTETRGGQPT